MSGPFLGINMASQSLRNFQRAIDTAGHNIANVNTRGYTRQTVDFTTMPSLHYYSNGTHYLGQGSLISSINRIRDGYLDTSLNNATSQQSKYNTLATNLRRIDQIYGEPSDTGISQALDRFFNSWSGLGSNPSGTAERAEVQLSGQVLTDRIRSRYADLSNLASNQTLQINSTVAQINNLGGQIATLNRQITTALASGGSPNDLMDQRDLAIADLSKLTNISKETFPDGSYAVYASGFTLVQGSAARTFPSTFDEAAGTFTDGTVTYNIRGGSLAGHLGGLNETKSQMTNLDNLANELRTQVNTTHMTGTNALGNTGVNFFNDVLVPPQTGAIDFNLSVEVKSDPNAIAAGLTGDAGDGSLAHLFAGMRDSAQVALGGRSFTKFFTDIVSKVANDGNYYQNAADTESAVMTQISEQQQAISGVSVDDEMANLMKLQRSYQAAARALTLFDQVTEDLIGMLRR